MAKAKPVESQEPPVETPPEPVAAAPETQPVETETPKPGFVERLQELGFQGVDSEEAAYERVLETIRQDRERQQELQRRLAELEPLAQFGRELIAERGRQPQRQDPAAGSEPERWWNPPPVDLSLVERYRTVKVDPQTGEQVVQWREGTPAELRASVEGYQAYVERFAHRFTQRPDEVFNEAVPPVVAQFLSSEAGQQTIRGIVQEMLGATEQQRERETFEQQVYRENPDLFETNPLTGQPDHNRLSAKGIKIQQYIQDSGLADPRKAWHYASTLYQAEHAPAAPAKPPQERVEDARQRVLRNGTQPGNGKNRLPQKNGQGNANLSPGQDLLERLRAEGMNPNEIVLGPRH